MRAFCTVSAPLEVCASSAEQLSPGSRFLALRLLGQPQPKTLYFLVDAKSRVREVYTQTCLHFATQGMQDTELFGLAVLIDGEYMFADPESKLSKYGPKSWRSSHTHGLDANGRPLLELHFRVQFYIESSSMLKDETSRHNYYLQLRHNVLQRELARDQADQALVLLAGLALQADLGDAPSTAGMITTTTTLPGTATTAAAGGGCGNNNQPKEEERGRMGGSAMTTTLPKIRKRLSSYNERMFSYVSSSSSGSAKREAAAPPAPPPAPPTSSSSTSSSSASSSCCADYFRQEDYLPPSLQTARAKRALRACHREHQGLTPAEAEALYIQHACSLHETINAHTFRMRLAKSEAGAGSAWFVIYAKGIKILGGSSTSTSTSSTTEPETTFLWPNITKLSFERKKFEIRSGESRITLYAASDEKNKLLLTLCKDTHQWSMKLAARLKEVSKRQEAAEAEEAESHCLHASYACSRSLLLPYKSKNEQRISVISSTSSNTTSGIVSDRVHSEDELEIMINTPPAPLAAPSTESLALAHLLDRPSVSRQTSSVGQMSLKDLEEQLAALSVSVRPSVSSEVAQPPTQTATTCHLPASSNNNDSSTATDSPNSQHNIGSQCSSTCSTVVVTTPPAAATAVVHSTSSSLELGFSHTAQNSTLSESHAEDDDDDDFLPSAGNGVYTLAPPTETSGVYTMHSSELTGQSSELAESEKSSHYGIFQPAQGDVPSDAVDSGGGGGAGGTVGGGGSSAVDKSNEFRLRSDSNISTSSSFRGDGSDPTNNQHKLLSADELTNLIVGRGSYPSRPAVSSTLHSDCDYVTLSPHLDEIEVGAAREEEEVPPAPPPPPPYSARHEKTGLCGPPLAKPQQQTHQQQQQEQLIAAAPSPSPPPPAIPPVPKPVPIAAAPVTAPPPRRRDPPPYPTAHKPRPTSLICGSSQSEEITARFITTRPQISILKAHTSLLPDGAKPSYAAPTHYSSCNSNYASGSQLSLHHPQQLQHHPPHPPHHYHRHSGSTAIGIPLVPYGLHHKSSASLAPPAAAAAAAASSSQQACVLLPVIKPRQYLPPPPPSLPRQPPPPPPPGIYGSQQARNQFELYQQQLYSDVDYVIYPIQDPAVSQQEYLDAKQSALLAHLAYTAGWDTCKGHAIYRSTPFLPLALSTHSRYASTQNLSDTYVQLPGATTYSPLYSPSLASLCSQSFEPPPPPPLHPARSRSDDNLLNSFDSLPMPKVSKRLPPPPPPPYVNRRKKPPMPAPSEQPPPIPLKPQHSVVSSSGLCLLPPKKPLTLNPHGANSPLLKTSSGAQWAGERPKPDMVLGMSHNGNNSNSILAQLQASVAAQKAQQPPNPLDIALLREKSKHLDLPLISALCNDRSLLKQTKVTAAGAGAAAGGQATAAAQVAAVPTGAGVGVGGVVAGTASNHSTMNSATGTLSKARKSNTGTGSHRHPQDKLPPLPVQLAEANNYVMDPALNLKHHKSYNSQSQN